MVDIPQFNIFTQFLHISPIFLMVIAAVIGLGGLWFLINRIKKHKRKPEGPLSTLDEFDKPGYVNVYEIDRELEGASFVTFERANGSLDKKQIGTPFIFVMEDNSIERHHLNARGGYRCLDAPQLFQSFIPDAKKALTRLATHTDQLIEELRTGSQVEGKLSRHWRTFLLLFGLAGMIGLGLAAGTVHHP